VKLEFESVKILSSNEKLYPFWFEKGKKYKFISINKENINNDNNQIVFSQISNNNLKLFGNFLAGAVLARILSGPYFQIFNNQEFVSEYSGPIFLSINCESEIITEFSMLLNAEKKTEKKIELFLGWNLDEILFNYNKKITVENDYEDESINQDNPNNFYISEFNKELFVLFNKLRISPKKFRKQYLYHFLFDYENVNNKIIELKSKAEETDNILKKRNGISLLKYNNKCENISENTFSEILRVCKFTDDLIDTLIDKLKNKNELKYGTIIEYLVHNTEHNTLSQFINMLLNKEHLIQNIFEHDYIGIYTKRIEDDNITIITFSNTDLSDLKI